MDVALGEHNIDGTHDGTGYEERGKRRSRRGTANEREQAEHDRGDTEDGVDQSCSVHPNAVVSDEPPEMKGVHGYRTKASWPRLSRVWGLTLSIPSARGNVRRKPWQKWA